MEIQRALFNKLLALFGGDPKALETAVCACLGIDNRKARRLINCETHLRLSQVKQLADYFRVSTDALLQTDQLSFQYTPLTNSPAADYLVYLQDLLRDLRQLENEEGAAMLVAVEGIPSVHYMNFPLLMFFKLYVWHREATGYRWSFENFLREIDRPAYEICFQQITEAYSHVPTEEIWVVQALHPLRTRLLDGLSNGCFAEDGSKEKIYAALVMLVDRLAQYIRMGKKGEGGDFKMYLSHVPLGANGFLLSDVGGRLRVRAKQLNMVSLKTSDPTYCADVQARLFGLRRNAQLIDAEDSEAGSHFLEQLRRQTDSLRRYLLETGPENGYTPFDDEYLW